MSESNSGVGGVGGVGSSRGSEGTRGTSAAADTASANDPADVAEAMIGSVSGPVGVDTEALGKKVADQIAADPAFGAQVRQEVEAQLSPVDVGRLQGAIAGPTPLRGALTSLPTMKDPVLAANPTYSYNAQGQLVDACGVRVAEVRATPTTHAPAPSPSLADMMCNMPAISLGAGVSAYAGPGGGVAVGGSYDPKTGVLGLDGNAEVGVGVGFKAGPGGLTRSRDVERGPANSATRNGNDTGLSVGMGLSSNVQAGPVTVRGETELVGTSMDKSLADRSKMSYGLGGIGLGANANVNVAASGSWKIADPNCAVPMN